MKTTAAFLKPILALAALASQPILAFDPLMDEPEPFAQWKISKEVSYTASNSPTWEAASWFGASKEVGLGETSLNLDGSIGFLADDFQLDSAWNLEPKASATWSRGRLSLEGWGWGLWNDLGWTDEGGGTNLSWLLTDPAAIGSSWRTGVHGWISENSGSAVGLNLSRRSVGDKWSTGFAFTARRLWDVDATQQRPGSVRRAMSSTSTTDQWQALVQTNLDRNWKSVSAGVGLDLDLRASDASAMTSQNSMGKGKMSTSSSSFQYTGTVDPYADVSWTPGTWAFTVTTGWSTDVQQTKGSIQPTSTLWTAVAASKSW